MLAAGQNTVVDANAVPPNLKLFFPQSVECSYFYLPGSHEKVETANFLWRSVCGLFRLRFSFVICVFKKRYTYVKTRINNRGSDGISVRLRR